MTWKKEDFIWSVILVCFCKIMACKMYRKNFSIGWVCNEMTIKMGWKISVVLFKKWNKKKWFLLEGDFVKKERQKMGVGAA